MQIFENFISYRRKETLSEVQNIYHILTNKGYSTFCDIYSLNFGRFDDNIKKIIKSCTNFILVINDHSLDKCVENNDWLKMEIYLALKNKKNIICVFVGEIDFPEILPKEIDEIRYYNGLKYDPLYFNGFMDCLVSRFLVSKSEIEKSNDERDFVIENSIIIKYVGNASIVNIPHGVTGIGKSAFKDKTRIKEVIFPEGLLSIEDSAFERCLNISNIILPSSTVKIGYRAFSRCYNLTFVALNDELSIIGEEAFYFCTKIKIIHLGEKISNIHPSAFNNCEKLAIFDVDENNPYFSALDGILYDKEKTTLIRCPEGYGNDLVTVHQNVESLNSWCFSRCVNIIDIILPRHLKRIKAHAFSDCQNIFSLTLGDEIVEFDVSALDGWKKEQRIVVSKKFNPLIKYNINQKVNEKVSLQQEIDDHFPEYVMIKTTFESNEEAARIAKMLLYNRYIASAQLNKLDVFYTWNDEPCNENEIELSCITRGALYRDVEEFIRRHHSFDCCQLICIPIIKTSDKFGDWVRSLTKE